LGFIVVASQYILYPGLELIENKQCDPGSKGNHSNNGQDKMRK
jgi:hypothetical protein